MLGWRLAVRKRNIRLRMERLEILPAHHHGRIAAHSRRAPPVGGFQSVKTWAAHLLLLSWAGQPIRYLVLAATALGLAATAAARNPEPAPEPLAMSEPAPGV